MKTIYLFTILGIMNLSFAQTKSTGVVALSGVMTMKLDLNATTSTATLTLTGPSTRWFSLGFNATSMSANTDCVVMTSATQFSDEKLPGGHNAPTVDAINNWTVVSNNATATTRTVVATRPFNTGDANDYTFSAATNSLNFIWAYANSATYSVTDHGSNFGNKGAGFALGVEDYVSLDKIDIYPNPSNGIFNISKNTLTQITGIRVFDANAKLLKMIGTDVASQHTTVDLSDLSKGLYFIEISNDGDKVVRKILIE